MPEMDCDGGESNEDEVGFVVNVESVSALRSFARAVIHNGSGVWPRSKKSC